MSQEFSDTTDYKAKNRAAWKFLISVGIGVAVIIILLAIAITFSWPVLQRSTITPELKAWHLNKHRGR